ncbi:cellulose synthase/poly-beta-1,6-N-acetylglucosamine synthase-like glycosyltransferase [Kitasatospora gansuensis]|uniref:Cellulose synthase/poly-beta-1,6-N-acetylglucosamine synthase-like glycosyltransferase n=1 Tax=Kitasatospora gansuensis TaxID=258050 RepID=A0A7W7SF28_9ACTN|nr:glycosyltransferase [Kitasatospora gansuensis]MBB4949285.1 cellulose synthase/poly-beta-1,6-N-acetylglucosamine synthase-like glycosyltransferase [Kitasatospora gansuensis]
MDAVHAFFLSHRTQVLWTAQLLSLALLAYMLFVFGRFLLYWAGSADAFRRNRPAEPGDPAAFRWHLVIPCRDEEAVVGQTLTGLRRSSPEAHLWVVDDDSEDRTRDLVLAAADRDPMIHLVQRRRPDARIGKGAALNAAYRQISDWLPAGTDHERVVLGVVDADGELATDTLALVSSGKAFGRPDTGAVQIGVRMRNADDPRPLPDRGRVANAFARALVRMQDVEFQAGNAGMQLLRRRTGSVGLGGNGQFVRLAALDALAGGGQRPWPERALLEDYESGLELRLAGYRLTHVQETRVSQEGLVSGRRFLTQRTRWAQGNMQCLRYTGRVLRSPHYTLGGKAEVMYTFLQPVVAVLLVLLFPLSLGISLATRIFFSADATTFEARYGPLMLLAFVLAALPLVCWGFAYRRTVYPNRSRLLGLLWGLALWLYTYHIFLVATRAAVRLLLGRNGWAKTRRNAEQAAAGAPTALEA